MAEFTLATQTVTANVVVTRLAGDMDDEAFDALEDEFNKLLESGIQGVVLDISALDSATSAGLGALLNMTNILAGRKGKLVVAAPRPKMQGTIEMLGIQEALNLEESAETAKKTVLAAIK